MFVLMDMEWVENRDHHIGPTQIAALRVDEKWNGQEQFYTHIRPRDSSFYLWNHVGYTGAEPTTYLYAPKIHRVLTRLSDWLREDDILCFWADESQHAFQLVYRLVLDRDVPQRIVVLRKYISSYLNTREQKPGNPYAICTDYGDPADGPKHQAQNDVLAMQKALACIQYPAAFLYGEPLRKQPQEGDPGKSPVVPAVLHPYQVDVRAGIFHRTGCPEIPPDADLAGRPNLKSYFRKKLRACPHCVKKEIQQEIRARNQELIDRTQYQFLYIEGSEVFHRRECPAILRTRETIKGSVYYDACADTGRIPCRLCKPVPGLWHSAAQRKAARRSEKMVEEANMPIPERDMNRSEQCAYNRYVQARTERFAAPPEAFPSETERSDFLTLTQPRFAFFSAYGYQAFHRRDCRKLQGLRNITGFAHYQDAIRAGRTPCKLCKPTAKQDIVCSIPIRNEKRTGESRQDLEMLCEENGYAYAMEKPFFCFETSVGKWKIDLTSTPYIVYHINLVYSPDNMYAYHRQPRLFLSLLDAFSYIQNHDEKLMERQDTGAGGLQPL